MQYVVYSNKQIMEVIFIAWWLGFVCFGFILEDLRSDAVIFSLSRQLEEVLSLSLSRRSAVVAFGPGSC